jgi:transcriptional antiterminator NusG
MAEANWYVVHTYSGYENKVKADIEKTIENRNLHDEILEVRVPMQEVVEMKNGKRKVVQKKMFPSYVLINMIMNDETWYVVRNTPGVTGFIGSSGGGAKPFPVADGEVEAILRKMGMHNKDVEITFTVGDRVKILTGPFANMEGVVESIDAEAKTANILVIIFGRETPTTIDCADVEKVEY